MEVENLEGPQTGRDVLKQGTEHTATYSVQKEKSFSLVVLAAVAKGKRFVLRFSMERNLLVK